MHIQNFERVSLGSSRSLVDFYRYLLIELLDLPLLPSYCKL